MVIYGVFVKLILFVNDLVDPLMVLTSGQCAHRTCPERHLDREVSALSNSLVNSTEGIYWKYVAPYNENHYY
jgi:hypothetical protein